MDLSEFANCIEENSARLVEINQGPLHYTRTLNEFVTMKTHIEAELERRFPRRIQRGQLRRLYEREEPLGRFISNIASVEMSQANKIIVVMTVLNSLDIKAKTYKFRYRYT